jgi:large subunit ribosomal protein L4
MATVSLRTTSGAEVGNVELVDEIFGIEPNVGVMHQVVVAQLAAKRSGTQSTKTRAEVAGGGAKPFKQKGTGRARQGSIRAPQWRGGGVALGPKPRKYDQRTPKKMKRLALRSALSDRAAEGRVLVVAAWDFDAPRTKDAAAALTALGVEGRALVVVRPGDETAWRSFRNLPTVHVITPGELNTYDVLVSDWVVFTAETLPTGDAAATATAEDAAPAPAAPKAAKATKAPVVEDAPEAAAAPADDEPIDEAPPDRPVEPAKFDLDPADEAEEAP